MTQLEKTGLAQVFNAPVDLLLDDTNCVQPDLVIIRETNSAIITERAIEGVPDVVVEIVSKSNPDRDRFLKRQLYERFRIPEYWIVEPSTGYLQALRLDNAGYVERARYDRAGTLTCPDFPTLSVGLAKIFE